MKRGNRDIPCTGLAPPSELLTFNPRLIFPRRKRLSFWLNSPLWTVSFSSNFPLLKTMKKVGIVRRNSCVYTYLIILIHMFLLIFYGDWWFSFPFAAIMGSKLSFVEMRRLKMEKRDRRKLIALLPGFQVHLPLQLLHRHPRSPLILLLLTPVNTKKSLRHSRKQLVL